MSYLKIFEKAKTFHEIDNKIKKRIKNLFKVLSPSNYEPFIEECLLCAYLDGIEQFNEELSYVLSDYFYEGVIGITTKDGKEFDFRDEKQFIKYLEYLEDKRNK